MHPHPEPSTSFREKSAWACLAVTLAVFVPYFLNVFASFKRGELHATTVMGWFIAAVVFSTVLQTVAHLGIALRSRQEPKDERDLAIEFKSFRNAYGVLAASSFFGVLGIMTFALAPASGSAGPWLAPAFVSQVFLLCFTVAEVTKYLTQAVCYRRGV